MHSKQRPALFSYTGSGAIRSTLVVLIASLMCISGCNGESQSNGDGPSDSTDLARVATTGDYEDLDNLPELFDGYYQSLAGKPDFAEVAFSGDYQDLDNRPDGTGDPAGGKVVQTPQSLIDDGPQGEYVVVDWEGDSDIVIDSMSSGVIPEGGVVRIEVPRTIDDSGGPDGHGPETLGNYVEFHHGSSITAAANNNLSYRATPNANDWRGDNAALFELLEFVRTDDDHFLLSGLPESRSGFTHGDPQYIPDTSSRTGFAWERRADGTAHLTNGTVQIPAYAVGGSQPRFRFEFVWPFRFEQHHGNHRTVQFGISTKSTDVYWSALSVPRNSSTDREDFLVNVYVDPSSQHLVSHGDSVSVTITGTGNWRLPSDQW